jgi:chorismate mutase
MHKLLYIPVVLGFALPFATFAADDFQPSDVGHIFLDEQSEENTYKIVIENEDGSLYRLRDEVSFTGSRYQLHEDIAYQINSHRRFAGFDDEDIPGLLWSVAPFAVADITKITTNFTQNDDGDSLTVYAHFQSGNPASRTVSIDQTFTSSAEVSAYVANVTNGIESLQVGEVSTEMVADLHQGEYTGLSYFTPVVDSVIFNYNEEEQTFKVDVAFQTIDEARSFNIAFNSSKEKLIEEATTLINDLYVEYEDAAFDAAEIRRASAWKNTPWMIDDIEEIQVATSSDEVVTVEFTVKTRLTSDLVGTTILSSSEELDINDPQALAAEAATLLEEHQLFIHQFDADAIEREIVETNEQLEAREELLQEIEEQNNAVEIVSDQDNTPTEESQGNTETTDDTSTENTNQDQDALYQLLLAAILEYIATNDLDIDTSNL